MHATSKIFACTAALLGLATSIASAGTFDVKSPDVAKGETEVGFNSSFFSGFPVNADLIRNSLELSASYGVTDWWKAGLKINFDKPADEHFRASTVGTEHQFSLRKFEKGFGLGWYAGVDVGVAEGETNTVNFGPIFQFGTDKTTIAVNPFLSKTFGKNREEGIAFTYAWQAKQEVREGFSVGIEGYGVIPNISDSPSTAFQEHRIGPVLYFERSLARNGNGGPSKLGVKDMKAAADDKGPDGPKLNIELGLLFGLTDGTQDRAIKFKGGVTF